MTNSHPQKKTFHCSFFFQEADGIYFRIVRLVRHIIQLEEQSPARRVLVAVVDGRRQRGRPKLRWEDGVMEDARKLGRETGGMLQRIGTAGGSF
jgi:hypothetical protein